ncbi:MAG: DNA polymerase III subunit delta' [Desulfobacterales bacterium]
MPGFDALIGQERPVARLKTLLCRGAVPHALLFCGIEGVGKAQAALLLAMALNCGAPAARAAGAGPCGECRACRNLQAGQHPDLLTVAPEGPLIRVAQVRQLCASLAMKPYAARTRVVIIKDARAMNPEAGNALLKVLEEPPDRTVLILLATQTADLLPTIVSRCQHLRFGPIVRRCLQTLLTERHGVAPGAAEIAAAMSGGSLTRALRFSQADWIARRDWLIAAIGLDRPETLSSRPLDVLLAVAEKLAGHKAWIPEALDLIVAWLRDLLVFRHAPARLINQDRAALLGRASGRMTDEALLQRIQAVGSARSHIEANLNARLVLERLMLQLAGRLT